MKKFYCYNKQATTIPHIEKDKQKQSESHALQENNSKQESSYENYLKSILFDNRSKN